MLKYVLKEEGEVFARQTGWDRQPRHGVGGFGTTGAEYVGAPESRRGCGDRQGPDHGGLWSRTHLL